MLENYSCHKNLRKDSKHDQSILDEIIHMKQRNLSPASPKINKFCNLLTHDKKLTLIKNIAKLRSLKNKEDIKERTASRPIRPNLFDKRLCVKTPENIRKDIFNEKVKNLILRDGPFSPLVKQNRRHNVSHMNTIETIKLDFSYRRNAVVNNKVNPSSNLPQS